MFLSALRQLNANPRFVQGPPTPSVGATPAKKEPPVPPVTPLEKMLQDMGAIREDGSDKFFGMENVSLWLCRGTWNAMYNGANVVCYF